MDYTVNRQTTLDSGEFRQLCQKRELNFWKVLECFSLIQHLPRNCLRFFAGSRVTMIIRPGLLPSSCAVCVLDRDGVRGSEHMNK